MLEGKLLEKVDQREMLAELAINMRYTMNAEKVKPNKMFNKEKEERKVKQIFNKGINDEPMKKSMTDRLKNAIDHFKKKGAKNE